MLSPAHSCAPAAVAERLAAARAELDRYPFRPVWWARSALAQTVCGAWTRGPREDALRLERWDLPDGDFLRVHFADGDPDAPLVLLLHGLEGSCRSGYVAHLLREVTRAGWSFAVMEFRSCGGELNRAMRSYHSGATDDLDHVVARLCELRPRRPLCVVGYSLGGNVLLKWLGEQGERAPAQVLAAAAVSTPFDLEVAARRCDERYRGLIARHFLDTLIPKALAKGRQHPGVLDADAVARCRTFATFDDLVTAPLHGFRDAQHYWRSQSCAQFLPAVRRPTLLVSSADDPLVPASVWPHDAIAESPYLIAQFSERGGHCAFVSGGVPGWPVRWAEAQVLRFLSAYLGDVPAERARI